MQVLSIRIPQQPCCFSRVHTMSHTFFAAADGLNNYTKCPSRGHVETITLHSGTATVADCLCPAGTKMTISNECLVCPALMSASPGATAFNFATAVVLLVSFTAAVSMLVVNSVLFLCAYRRRAKHLEGAAIMDMALGAISSVNEVAFLLVLVRSMDFIVCGRMRCYAELWNEAKLLMLDTSEELNQAGP